MDAGLEMSAVTCDESVPPPTGGSPRGRRMAEAFAGIPALVHRTVVVHIPVDSAVDPILEESGTRYYLTKCQLKPGVCKEWYKIEAYRHTGLHSGCATYDESTTEIGFGMYLVHRRVTTFPPGTTTPVKESDGVCSRLTVPTLTELYAYKVGHGSSCKVYLEVGCIDMPWLDVVKLVLTHVKCITTLRSVMDAGSIRTLRNLSPRAWDHAMVELPDHKYIAKVDGERSWCVIDKSVAFSFKHGSDRYMWDVNVLSTAIESVSPVVIDTEYCGRYGVFFIDCLTDATGNLSPPGRTLE
jgi:hypothetical protein